MVMVVVPVVSCVGYIILLYFLYYFNVLNVKKKLLILGLSKKKKKKKTIDIECFLKWGGKLDKVGFWGAKS